MIKSSDWPITKRKNVMRKFKFRAWDNERKEMNYKIIVGNTCDHDSELYTAHCIFIDDGWLHFDEHSDIVIEQYIGAKGGDGLDIYEGDRLKCDGFTGAVLWDDDESRFAIKPDGEDMLLALITSEMVAFEMIGNIHE